MYVAKVFKDRRAFAIVTNDSDFLLFPDCCTIMIDDFFDCDGSVRKAMMECHQTGFLPPASKFICKCIKTNDIVKALGLENIDQICDFAFLRGNDCSKPFTDRLHTCFKVNPNDFEGIVQVIRQNQPLIDCPVMSSFCKQDHTFQDAYNLTHCFYKLDFNSMPDDVDDVIDEKLDNLIVEAVHHGKLSANILSLSRGYHWCRIGVEIVRASAEINVSELAMQTFRSFLYQMLLRRRIPNNKVKEFCVLPQTGLSTYEIPIPNHDWLPKLNELLLSTIETRIKVFDSIMSHQEMVNFPRRVFEEFPKWGEAFVVYVLRYFRLQNEKRNLFIKRNELLACIASVLGTTEASIALTQTVSCRPSPRSLTVGTWLQNIYRHAASFLARSLDLDKEIPKPHNFFSGSVFTSFYFVDEGGDKVKEESILKIRQLKKNILRDNSRIVNYVMASF